MSKFFNKQTGIKILTGLGFLALFFGWKFYNKGRAHDDIKKSLGDMCGPNQDCLTAVDKYFDECFEENYSIGSKHRAASLKEEAFLKCFNTRSGTVFFEIEPPEEAEVMPDPNQANPAAHAPAPQSTAPSEHGDEDLEDGN